MSASAQPALPQDQIDKRVSAEKHSAFLGPVASLESLCKEVNDDYAKHAKSAGAICTPGSKKALTGGPVQEIGFYTVALPQSSRDVFVAVHTAKGWFVQQRTFGSAPAGGGISHHTPVSESIPLERARQTSGGLFVVHVHHVNSFMPGMGNMGRSETETESQIHCIMDAQGTPLCTSAVAVTSRRCNDPAWSDAGCSEESLLGNAATP